MYLLEGPCPRINLCHLWTTLRSLAINTTLVRESLAGAVFGQQLAVREIAAAVTEFAAATSGHQAPATLLLLLYGWVGVGKVGWLLLLKWPLTSRDNCITLKLSFPDCIMTFSLLSKVTLCFVRTQSLHRI